MQEYNPVAVFHGFQVDIGNAGVIFGQAGQFKVMRGEQGKCLDADGKINGAGPCQ